MDENKKVGAGFGILVLRDGKVLLGKRHDDPEKASSMLHGEKKVQQGNLWKRPDLRRRALR